MKTMEDGSRRLFLTWEGVGEARWMVLCSGIDKAGTALLRWLPLGRVECWG